MPPFKIADARRFLNLGITGCRHSSHIYRGIQRGKGKERRKGAKEEQIIN